MTIRFPLIMAEFSQVSRLRLRATIAGPEVKSWGNHLAKLPTDCLQLPEKEEARYVLDSGLFNMVLVPER